jgi:excisionase family DNA binding protein
MDKICIVKLRKSMTPPAMPGPESGQRKNDPAGGTVSLMLTPEQMRVLQSDPNLLSFISGAPAKGSVGPKHREESIVFQFTFEPAPPVRMLKMSEVVQMLRISRGYLRKIIRQGELKSYKIGRLRRIMFDDILTYLERSREFIDMRQRVSKLTTTQGRIV